MIKTYMIISPRMMSVTFDDHELLFYVDSKDIDSKLGKHYLKKNSVPDRYCLNFNGGIQNGPAVSSEDGLRLSGKALMQLLLFHGKRYGNCEFCSDDLKLFFEDNSLNNADRWLHNVGLPLLLGTPSSAIPGSMARYSVNQERLASGSFWRAIGAPAAEIRGAHGLQPTSVGESLR